MASSSGHRCAVNYEGTPYCWGSDNGGGQLGLGYILVWNLNPAQVSGMYNVIEVSAGTSNSFFLKANGRFYFSGCGDGWLQGSQLTCPDPPSLATAITDASHIASSGHHHCVIHFDGTLSCWGDNHENQAVVGYASDWINVPTEVTFPAPVAQVAPGGERTCARLVDGTAHCWGNNAIGLLASSSANGTTPGQVNNLTDAVHISSGDNHSCVIKSDGTAWCWGVNNWGQLGDGTGVIPSEPVQVVGLDNVVSIECGHNHTCAATANGLAWCWGKNDMSQLGSMSAPTTPAFSPVRVDNLWNAVKIDASFNHTCALTTDSRIKCWGANFVGQLGNGVTLNYNFAVEINDPF
jgi:alpha-tubulin suppressor-like RCC1 family protein